MYNFFVYSMSLVKFFTIYLCSPPLKAIDFTVPLFRCLSLLNLLDSRRKRNLPNGHSPTRSSSIIVFIIDHCLRMAYRMPAHINLLFAISLIIMLSFWNMFSSFSSINRLHWSDWDYRDLSENCPLDRYRSQSFRFLFYTTSEKTFVDPRCLFLRTITILVKNIILTIVSK